MAFVVVVVVVFVVVYSLSSDAKMKKIVKSVKVNKRWKQKNFTCVRILVGQITPKQSACDA